MKPKALAARDKLVLQWRACARAFAARWVQRFPVAWPYREDFLAEANVILLIAAERCAHVSGFGAYLKRAMAWGLWNAAPRLVGGDWRKRGRLPSLHMKLSAMDVDDREVALAEARRMEAAVHLRSLLKRMEETPGRVRGKRCGVEGCAGRYRAQGLCGFHYGRRRRGQPLEAPPLRQRNVGLACAAPGCTRPAKVKGLCSTHRERQLNGLPMDVRLGLFKYAPGTTCEAAGCSRTPMARGLCSLHYQRKMNAQKLGAGT
jgi:hypothetical protein